MSTNPNGRQSGLLTPVTGAAAGGTQIFTKAADPKLTMASTASEVGDTQRYIKNTSASVTVQVAGTQAGTQDANNSWPLGPGEGLTILGPAGFGYGGDVWVASAGGAASVAIWKA